MKSGPQRRNLFFPLPLFGVIAPADVAKNLLRQHGQFFPIRFQPRQPFFKPLIGLIDQFPTRILNAAFGQSQNGVATPVMRVAAVSGSGRLHAPCPVRRSLASLPSHQRSHPLRP